MVPDLETERLILTRRTEADLEACVAMDSDLEVRRFITPQFRDRFESTEYRATLRERISIDAGPGLGWWIIRARGNPESFHGMALLIPVALEGPEIEIGWRLPRTSWGKGYATEAASRVVGYAFRDLALTEIIACINPENMRSISIASRLGFVRAGRKRAYGTEFDLYCLRLGKA
jgi:RimJ/RimL family protein N-acetyltransferase